MPARSITPAGLARCLLEAARGQGFDLAAILPLPEITAAGSAAGKGAWAPPRTAAHYLDWLSEGFHGEMAYLARPDAVAKRLRPESLVPGLGAILAVGLNYHSAPLPRTRSEDPSLGAISSYARGSDYHSIIQEKLASLASVAEAYAGHAIDHGTYVDTAPILERDLAARAGLGFVGKNTCLINPGFGSWLLLGELFLAHDLSSGSYLAHQQSGAANRTAISCGRCTRCLDACPTGALIAPHILDSRRCISYLTIELRGPIPKDLRPLIGNRIFGCDICQEVCPWNLRFARSASEPAFEPRPEFSSPRLLDLLALDETAFAERFRGSPILRARLRGLQRNAAVALGNWGNPEAVPALAKALSDGESLVRGHAAWALGRIGTEDARRALTSALCGDTDPWARTEIGTALEGS